MAPTYLVEACGKTDVGLQRQHNEDEVGCFPELGLFVVADGMGGQSTGGWASEIVVASARDLFQETASDTRASLPFPLDAQKSYQENRLIAAARLGNLRIMEFCENKPWTKGLGSTIAALSIVEGRAQMVHVGDSRVSLLRDGVLSALTRDHTLLNDYIEHIPTATPEQLAALPRNVITRILGYNDKTVIDSRSLPVNGGDIFVVASDGLHCLVPEGQVQAILVEYSDPAKAAEELIAAANKNGGDDNVSCVVVKVTER